MKCFSKHRTEYGVLFTLILASCGEQILQDTRGTTGTTSGALINSIVTASQAENHDSQIHSGKVQSTPSEPVVPVDKTSSQIASETDEPSVNQSDELSNMQNTQIDSIPWEPKDIYFIVAQNCFEPCHSNHREFKDKTYFERNSAVILRSIVTGSMPRPSVRPLFAESTEKLKLIQYLESLPAR